MLASHNNPFRLLKGQTQEPAENAAGFTFSIHLDK